MSSRLLIIVMSHLGQMLEGFAQQQGVWRYCVHFVQHSRNEHLLMYSLNLLEVMVLQSDWLVAVLGSDWF